MEFFNFELFWPERQNLKVYHLNLIFSLKHQKLESEEEVRSFIKIILKIEYILRLKTLDSSHNFWRTLKLETPSKWLLKKTNEYLQFWEISLIIGHASWLKEGNDEKNLR